ncbi:MAG: AAC(3) family N-acetyltransferase [Clostridia bacterium]|nr:AAC(3) family N-acetyltransferase [Clostridia bacterium]
MSEKDIIANTERPITINDIHSSLKKLGIKLGDIVLMHCSMSTLGWICGGAQALLLAVMKAVGTEGTLVMPAHSGDWSDPINWQHPPVPKEWVPIIRDNMPAYNKDMTPARGIGKVAELFRTLPDVERSDHPLLSFSAWGSQKHKITCSHPLVPQLGMESPLGALYKLNAKILFLGTDYETCTAFHLAETMLEETQRTKSGTSMMVNGNREWVEFEDFEYNSDDFVNLGTDFENSNMVTIGKIGNAECRLFNMRDAVDFAQNWLRINRKFP